MVKWYDLDKRETVIETIENLNFSRALGYLKMGFHIRRKFWGGGKISMNWYALDSKTNTVSYLYRFIPALDEKRQYRLVVDYDVSIKSKDILENDWIAEKLQLDIKESNED